MATPEDKKPAGDGGGEGGTDMTIGELTAMVKSLMPQLTAMQAALDALKGTPAATAVVEDADKDAALTAALDAADKDRTKHAAAMAALATSLPATVLKQLRERDQLAKSLSDHVGVFDAADMTHAQVAAYGIEKLGIKDTIPAGHEALYLGAYLSALPTPSEARARGRVADVTDSADEEDGNGKVPESIAKYTA